MLKKGIYCVVYIRHNVYSWLRYADDNCLIFGDESDSRSNKGKLE